jgi:RNA-directed DNA polymerase
MIYVSLVHKIREENSWKIIQNRFKKFSQNNRINCISIPRQSLSKNSDKAEQIINWWNHTEQFSIELALDYSCLIHTDLTDCYGAIYTHSIAWALHEKDFAKNNRDNKSVKS